MSIPQICPSCGNHISAAHATDCCYGTTEYAYLGWPSASDGVALINIAHPIQRRVHNGDSAGILTMGDDTASAIRRLLDYLNEEPDERPLVQPEPMEEKVADISDKTKILCRLKDKCNELRKEAAGIYNVEARAKRNFAADILESLIEEETSAW
jgi:hypothetical protein